MNHAEQTLDDPKPNAKQDSAPQTQDTAEAKAATKPKKVMKFTYSGPIASIIFSVVATVIFLGFPQIISIVFIGDRMVPTFDEVTIRSLWLPIILWAVFRIGIDIAYLIERSYTKRLALVSIVGNVLTAIVTIIVFASSRIVYWEFADFVRTRFAEIGAAWFGEILANAHLVILIVVLIVLVFETISVVVKWKSAEKKADSMGKESETAV